MNLLRMLDHSKARRVQLEDSSYRICVGQSGSVTNFPGVL